MTKRQRVVTYIAASIGVLAFGWMILIGGLFLMGGVATVSVVEHNDGVRVHLPVPMALVHAAAATTEVFFLDQIIDEIEVESGGHFSEMAPHVLELLEVLDDVPNGTIFVQVFDGDEHVTVSKVRGKFRVEVESPDVSVDVAVPTRSVKKIVRTLVR